jgi:eukaryotic-like serine/threonine-protein kinase
MPAVGPGVARFQFRRTERFVQALERIVHPTRRASEERGVTAGGTPIALVARRLRSNRQGDEEPMTIALASSFADHSGVPAWIGCYRVLDLIAEGGMGRVFRAFDTGNSRMVAMKTPRAGTAAEIACLHREAAILRRLSHPGIVRVLGEGTREGMPWMAMELLEGCTLADQLESMWEGHPRGRERTEMRELPSDDVPTVRVRLVRSAAASPAGTREERPTVAAGCLPRVASIVVQLAMILDHVHGRGLVHRDVKPENVILRSGGRVTLLDFGLARRANGGAFCRAENVCVGTMEYAAPEQILGEPTDARTDVYSLGCVLYELVTGQRPFDGESTDEVAQKHLRQAVVAPSRIVSDLPGRLDDLLMEMLAKRPGDRPATAGSAAHRLAMAVAASVADCPSRC